MRLLKSKFNKLLILAPLANIKFDKYLALTPLIRPRLTAQPQILSSKISPPFIQKRSFFEWTFWLTLFAYLVLCVGVYFQYVAPWITGDTNLRIGADSDRYWDFAADIQNEAVFSATQNLLGPVLLAVILKSGFAAMLVHMGLLLVALNIARTIPNINLAGFGFLTIANAELLPSLTTLNKEIFTLLASVMTVKYLQSRSKLLLLFTIFVAACARWEMVAILTLYLVTSKLKIQPRKTIAWLVMVIAIGYPFAFKILGVDPSAFDYLLEGANTILVLNKLQNMFLFPLVLPFKALMLMGGGWVSPRFYTDNLAFSSFTDWQQVIFQPLGCLAFLIVFFLCWRRGLLRLNSPVAVLSWITIIVVSASPFMQPRYVYGIYTMLCIELSIDRTMNREKVTSEAFGEISKYPLIRS